MRIGRDATPEVSVIVPMRNASRYIARCVASLRGQSYPADRYEIIIIDNNSDDGSPELVAADASVRLLFEKKPGAYAARNRGVMAARGRLLAFTDADCEPDKDWLANLIAPLASREVMLAQGRRIFAGKSRVLSLVARYEAEHAAYSLSPEGAGTHFGYTNNMAVRREAFERCGPFVEVARGADSVFVDRVVGAYSIDAIRFVRDAVICHLEMNGMRRWLMKRFIRGVNLQRTIRMRRYRRMGPRKMPILLERAVAGSKHAQFDTALLTFAIATGTVAFDLGRLSSRLSRLRGKSRTEDNADLSLSR